MDMSTFYSIKDFLEVTSAGDASFSPDGTRVAFLSNATGISQVFLTSVNGGEPEQLTDTQDPVSFVRFNPIKNVLIFGKAEGGNEQTQFFLLNLDTRDISDITLRPNTRHDFGAWSADGTKICFTSNERNGTDFDAYVMDIDTLEKRCVFDGGGWCATEGFSPQGTYVVVRRKHSNVSTDLYLLNLKTANVEHITPHEGKVLYEGALWLPDESAFFLVQDGTREFKGLARYSLRKRNLEYVLTPDWDIESATITQDGSLIAVTVNEDGYERAFLYDASTLEPYKHRLPLGNIYRMRFSGDGTRIVFSLGDSRKTSDIWIYTLKTKESYQLTHSHQGVPSEAMVEPELIHYTSFDGLRIPAFIYRPSGIEPNVQMPVIINIHGGPEAQYQPIYQPVMQYLVYNGHVVLAPNVRGSSGYGKSYMALDDVEKRLDSVKDIVALRDTLATMPDIDTDKIALYGASYGGFMVLACLAFYPKLWAAGVDIVGIVNFVTFLENTAVYRRALREAEYGSLENNRDLLESISPLRAIESIQAPLFVIHGANDPRVPLSEATLVVTKLTEVGGEVELLVYPDEGHGIAKLKNKLDAYPKVVEFLRKALA